MAERLHGTRGRRRIYLMRHGEVSYFDDRGRALDPDSVALNEAGIAQARRMATALAEIPLDRAGHTGLERSRQTADLVLDGHDVAIEEHAGLREIRPGELAGLPEDGAEVDYSFDAATRPGARFGGGEAYVDFEARIRARMPALVAAPGWSRLLLVGHDGTNRAILGWATGAGLTAFAGFEQDPGCLNIIDIDVIDGQIARTFVKAVNLTPDNPVKQGNYLTSLEQVFRKPER